MKTRRRRLLTFASLVLPLVVLAVFGSAELGRQSERAERALSDQAREFLREPRDDLNAVLRGVEELLDSVPDLARIRCAAASRVLRAANDAVLDLVVIDGEGELLFPRRAPPEIESLPFQSPSQRLQHAEMLELLGDVDGARDALADVIEELEGEGSRFRGRESILLRARFALAGLCRRGGDLDAAEVQYAIAGIDASAPPGVDNDAIHAQRATIGLWCDLALAEIDAERGGGLGDAVRLAQAIADGAWDSVSEPMLEAVLDELAHDTRHDGAASREVDAARDADEVRRAGRTFAGEYRTILRETVRRRLGRTASTAERIHVVHPTRNGTSILALRPARPIEHENTLDDLRGAAWIGIRIDLDQILAETLADRLASTDSAFTLVVDDPDSGPIAPPPETAPVGVEARADEFVECGVRLRAIPLDAEAQIVERRESIRNRALLVLLLCAAAGGGALLLVRSVARESELADLKVGLVSRMTHDLKTPLALIRMYAETIGRGRARTPEDTRRFAGIVQREADALTRMVERVLDFSRSQAGTLSYTHRRTDLVDLLRGLVDAYAPHAEARGMRLVAELPEAPVVVDVDPGALESAILDLLENAVKYSAHSEAVPHADGTIALRLRRSTDRAVVEVADRGIGIPEGEHDRVFESFVRGSNAGEARGAGLGLALIRHFCAAHGGSVRAEPRPGGGTVVSVNLPLATKDEDEQD